MLDTRLTTGEQSIKGSNVQCNPDEEYLFFPLRLEKKKFSECLEVEACERNEGEEGTVKI